MSEKLRAERLARTDLISNRALDRDDEDKFGYRPIAGRVAETLTVLDPPLTVGLFGPWGSGKSSMFELLRRELDDLKADAQLVKYDASTYGGEALKRNFISHIASDLGYKADKFPLFHRGLYESTRRTELDFKAIKGSAFPAARLFIGLYAGFLILASLLMGVTSVATDEDFLGQISHSLPSLIAPSAIAGVVAALAAFLLKGASVEAEQSQPASDEAFARCFQALVAQARSDKKFDRLIVFVDELDRCSSEDVVTTLTAIRTFLHEKHSVFVVAADRAALERALEEKLPQPTPVDEENPYYSSASSFFDKVFHDRVPLPPLRGPRLYEWAYEQVKEREGYWATLRSGDDHSDLRRTLYFLIPSHVRAPRRVKVLLNSFVRNAAIAAHSGFDWQKRAREIAKLTALDTEFPALGDDLRIEHRLPILLLNPPTEPSERVRRLLRKHGGSQVGRPAADSERAALEDGGDGLGESSDRLAAGDAEPADAIIANATEAQRHALARSGHELLRRYLARTRDVSIGRDLLFLDPAGAAVGLDDPELGERLDQAVDVPSEVVEHVNGLPDVQTRRLAARVLAHMADNEFGIERTNVMSALLGVVEALGEDVDEVADEIVGAVESYSRDEQLEADHLAGALSLALAGGASALEDDIFDDPRLFGDNAQLGRVARLLPRVPARHKDGVHAAVADAIGRGEAQAFTDLLADLPTADATALIGASDVHGAIATYVIGAEEPRARDWLIERLYADADERADGAPLRFAIHEFVLHEELAYGVMRDNAAQVVSDIGDTEEADNVVLRGFVLGPAEDFGFWAGLLSAGDYASRDNGSLAVRAVERCLKDLQDLGAEALEARLGLVEQHLLPFFGMSSEERQRKVQELLVSILEANVWWTSSDALERQERLHQLGHLLANASEVVVAVDVVEALRADVQRAPMDPTVADSTAIDGVRVLGQRLGAEALPLLEYLGGVGQHPDGSVAIQVTRAKTALAVAVRATDKGVDATVVTLDEIVAAATSRSTPGLDAVKSWLRLGPRQDEVKPLIQTLGNTAPASLVDAVAMWSRSLRKGDRTAFAIGLVEADPGLGPWIGAVVREGVDEEVLVRHISHSVDEASRGDEREELSTLLASVRPVEASAQRQVADLIIELLSTGKNVDFKAAVKAVPALGTQHRSAGRLRDAFKLAAEEHHNQLSERAAKELADSGVRVPKKALKKGAWDKVKGLFR
jgi:hypothetical protein